MIEGGQRGYRGNICTLRDSKGIYINRAEVILRIVVILLQNKAKRASEHDVSEQQNTAKKPNTEPSNLTTKTCTNTINQIAKTKLVNVASPETKNKQIRIRGNCQTRAGVTDKNLQKSKKRKHEQFSNDKKTSKQCTKPARKSVNQRNIY